MGLSETSGPVREWSGHDGTMTLLAGCKTDAARLPRNRQRSSRSCLVTVSVRGLRTVLHHPDCVFLVFAKMLRDKVAAADMCTETRKQKTKIKTRSKRNAKKSNEKLRTSDCVILFAFASVIQRSCT